ncbi:MAG TPA: hypothetical protein DCL54_14860 [Alphaproteobacteria bacterium]|nr:hypothetical protein [Alphaproteobacteria bacterium]
MHGKCLRRRRRRSRTGVGAHPAGKRGHMDIQAIHDHAVQVLAGKVPGTDRSAARALFAENAARGHVGSMVFLGIVLLDGVHGPQDIPAGVVWVRKAADAGHSEGEFLLGMCLAEGTGMERDLEQAIVWLRRAADKGHEEASFIFAELARRGHSDI